MTLFRPPVSTVRPNKVCDVCLFDSANLWSICWSEAILLSPKLEAGPFPLIPLGHHENTFLHFSSFVLDMTFCTGLYRILKPWRDSGNSPEPTRSHCFCTETFKWVFCTFIYSPHPQSQRGLLRCFQKLENWMKHKRVLPSWLSRTKYHTRKTSQQLSSMLSTSSFSVRCKKSSMGKCVLQCTEYHFPHSCNRKHAMFALIQFPLHLSCTLGKSPRSFIWVIQTQLESGNTFTA